MDGFLNKGEVSQAAQLAMSVLKAANAKSDCGKGLSILVKIVVRFISMATYMIFSWIIQLTDLVPC